MREQVEARSAEQAAELAVGRRRFLPQDGDVAAMLRQAGVSYARQGRYGLAYRMGVHELAVWRARADSETPLREETFRGYRDALDSLARIDRAVGCLHEVADCLDELLELLIRHGRSVDAHSAWTLRELGAVMLEAGRPDAALDHLSRADACYRQLDKATTDPRRHAVCLVLAGLAHRSLGQHARADKSFNRALATSLVNAPEVAAAVRVLSDVTPVVGELPVVDGLVLAEFGLPAWPSPDLVPAGTV